METLDRQFLLDAITKHKACLQGISSITDAAAALRRLIELEGETGRNPPSRLKTVLWSTGT